MDGLPVEIVEQIFKLSSQRNIATFSTVCKKWRHTIISQPALFYSTIRLYSLQQVKKFIKKAKETIIIITNKQLAYYVHHLYLCCEFQHSSKLIRDLLVILPNIQSIHSLKKYTIDRFVKPPITNITLPPLKNISHLPYWYIELNKRNWISIINENKLKSLSYRFPSNDIGDDDDDGDDDDEENDDTLPFHFKKAGPVKTIESVYVEASLMNYFDGEDELPLDNFDYQSKILFLSPITTTDNNNHHHLFHHLTSLTIAFSKSQNGSDIYELDERTLESIHQSCPQLLKLQLNYFFMNISEYYNNNNTILPAHHLKEFKMYGSLMDPKCYTYLSLKYPQLESFELITQFISYIKDQIPVFQAPIFNMLTQYRLLKRLSIQILCGEKWNLQFWPHQEFLQWLTEHPHQLTHLTYPYHLFPKKLQQLTKKKEVIDRSEIDLHHHHHHSIPSPSSSLYHHHNKMYLNYLTSLTMDYGYLIDTVTEYLLFHPSATTISRSIKELKIIGFYRVKRCRSLFYLYDWLDVFPNVSSLTLYNLFMKGENNDPDEEEECNCENDNYDEYIIQQHQLNEEKEHCGIYLHQLIKQRNQQNNNNNDKEKKYALKKLEIVGGVFYLKNKDEYENGNENGFDSFLNHQKLPFIKWINFSNVCYAYIGLDDNKNDYNNIEPNITLKEISIHLPHSNLDYFAMNNFRIVPWSKQNLSTSSNLVVTKIIVNNNNGSDNKDNDDINSSSSPSQQKFIVYHDKVSGYEHGSIHYFVQLKSYGLRLNCKYVDEILFYNNYLKK